MITAYILHFIGHRNAIGNHLNYLWMHKLKTFQYHISQPFTNHDYVCSITKHIISHSFAKMVRKIVNSMNSCHHRNINFFKNEFQRIQQKIVMDVNQIKIAIPKQIIQFTHTCGYEKIITNPRTHRWHRIWKII